ncbi:MAG TPA: hypothetical protein DCZ94_11685 [Lentisphaeria bacterium]|nr:MAG: hypothetical protein A2X48_00475 [Lentisphaerae bacterium GWF2_49_21]HBC87608.1 hypothetical protein [Lentisphaeria bacterium]
MKQKFLIYAKVLIIPLLIVLVLASCAVGRLPSTLEILYNLCIGWAMFIKNVVLKAHVYWPSLFTGVVAFIVLILCVHSIFIWLAREKIIPGNQPEGFKWKFKWSLYAVFLLIIAFVAGIVVISLIHQSFWLYQDISANRILE